MSLNRAPSRQQQIPNNIFNGVGRRHRHKSTKAKKKKQQEYRATKAERLRVLATQELLASEHALDSHSHDHLQQRPRVAIIGGGAAGLASLRNLVAVSRRERERDIFLIADSSQYLF